MKDTKKMSEQENSRCHGVNWVSMENRIDFIRDELLGMIKDEVEGGTLEGKTVNAIFYDDKKDGRSYLASVKRMAKEWGLGLVFKEYEYGEEIEDKEAAYFIIGGTFFDQNRYAIEKGLKNTMQLSVDPYFDPSVSEAVVCAIDELVIRIEENRQDRAVLNNIVVIGRSDNAFATAKRLADMRDCTVTLVHTKTEDISKYTKEADCIVSFAGSPNLIKAYMVKDNAAIIPVGMSKIGESKFTKGVWVDDVDCDSMLDYKKNVYIADGIGRTTAAWTLYRVGMVLSASAVKDRKELKEKYGK